MMGIIGSFKVVFSKYQKQMFINQVGNHKQALFIEVVGTINRQLSLFIILKEKKQKDD